MKTGLVLGALLLVGVANLSYAEQPSAVERHINARLPDGSIARFPDGTPDDVIDKAIKKLREEEPERFLYPALSLEARNQILYCALSYMLVGH